MPSGTGFINLSRLLDLNKETVDRMAREAGDSLESRGFGAERQLDKELSDYNGLANRGIIGYDPARAMSERNYLANGFGKYEAPGPFEYSNDARKNAYEASRDARLYASDAGRQAMLRQNGGRGGFGGTLDAALMGAAGQPRFEQISNRFSGLQDRTVNDASRGDMFVRQARDESDANVRRMTAERMNASAAASQDRWNQSKQQDNEPENERAKEARARRGALARLGGRY